MSIHVNSYVIFAHFCTVHRSWKYFKSAWCLEWIQDDPGSAPLAGQHSSRYALVEWWSLKALAVEKNGRAHLVNPICVQWPTRELVVLVVPLWKLPESSVSVSHVDCPLHTYRSTQSSCKKNLKLHLTGIAGIVFSEMNDLLGPNFCYPQPANTKGIDVSLLFWWFNIRSIGHSIDFLLLIFGVAETKFPYNPQQYQWLKNMISSLFGWRQDLQVVHCQVSRSLFQSFGVHPLNDSRTTVEQEVKKLEMNIIEDHFF